MASELHVDIRESKLHVNYSRFKSMYLSPNTGLFHIMKIINISNSIEDSPYYVFVALCIVVIVVSLIKIAASNKNIECFREYFAVGYRAPDPSFF